MPDAPSFDLVIDAVDDGYTAHVQSAFGVGELPPQTFALPLDLGALPKSDDVESWVHQARIVRRSTGSAELRRARALGSALFEHLFTGELLACFRASRSALRPSQVLRLRLRLPAPLAALPWELLHDPRDDQFLALAPDIALVRYPVLPVPVAPLHLDGPLDVVVVAARPIDCAPIEVERELARISGALKGPLDQGRLTLEIIRGPDTLVQLQARLRRPAHVIHFLGHGAIDAQHGEGVLVFEDMDGKAELINAELLRMQIQKQRGQTRLVVLNACLGARHAGSNPFTSVGAALMRGGVPAVLAMLFEIPDEVGVDLARIFYTELAAGTPVDLAVNETRMQLYGRNPYRLDWVIPVLFLRAADGALFDRPASAPAPMPVVSPAGAPPARPAPATGRRSVRGRRWIVPALVLLTLVFIFRNRIGLNLPRISISTQSESAAQQARTSESVTSPPPGTSGVGAATSGTQPAETAAGGALPAPDFPAAAPAPTAQPLQGLNVSNTPGRSNNAELAIDVAGVLHVIWLDNTPRNGTDETIMHRAMAPDGTWSAAEDWTPGIEYLVDTYLVANPGGTICMLAVGIERLDRRCNADGRWSANAEPERLGVRDNFDPALDAAGRLHYVVGANQITVAGVRLDDGLAGVGGAVLAIDANGGFHAVWHRAGQPYSIEHRYLPDGGTTWQQQERLSADEAESANYPTLVADRAGDVHLAWVETGKVMFSRWNTASGWSPPIDLARGTPAGPPFLALDAQNRAHVVWLRDTQMHYAGQLRDGSWPAPRLIAVVNDPFLPVPRVAVDAGGTRHFLWQDAGTDGAPDIYHATLPPE